MIKNLKEKYGKSLEEWIEVVKKTGIQKHGEIIKFLKTYPLSNASSTIATIVNSKTEIMISFRLKFIL